METNKLAKEIVCKYLPYNLKVQCEGDKYFVTAIYLDDKKYSIHIKATDDWFNIDVKITEIKPILRPLSDLTKEIVVKGYNEDKQFIPMIKLAKLSCPAEKWKEKIYTETVIIENWKYTIYYIINEDGGRLSFNGQTFYYEDKDFEVSPVHNLELIELLFQWHFDLYNGIENGWAIDINTLNK